MCKYLVTREDLGNRVIGYNLYESKSSEIVGMTEKGILDLIKKGNVINGLKASEDGKKLELDNEGFYQTNMMVKRGINNYTPLVDTDCAINSFYTVVKQTKNKSGSKYEVISSRYGRTVIDETKLRVYIELGAIAGGAKLEGKKLIIASGVETEDTENEGTA